MEWFVPTVCTAAVFFSGMTVALAIFGPTRVVEKVVEKRVIVGQFKIGDTVRFVSGGPVFHVFAVGDNGLLELNRWAADGEGDAWENVDPRELIPAQVG